MRLVLALVLLLAACGRALTPAETALLAPLYGDTLDPRPVRLARAPVGLFPITDQRDFGGLRNRFGRLALRRNGCTCGGGKGHQPRYRNADHRRNVASLRRNASEHGALRSGLR